jgi:Uma2 family endonuclease
MAGATQRKPPRLSIELFRALYGSRPDEERWELINGVAMMMAPASIAHQRIASNLERLLNDALESHAPALTALQSIGVNLGPAVDDYDPEPDVAVIDSDAAETPGERYAASFYLVAEVVSASDRVDVESKRSVYKLHESCRCILTVQQDRFEVRVARRTDGGWTDDVVTGQESTLTLAEFGLRCKLADLYRGTPLLPRRAPRR